MAQHQTNGGLESRVFCCVWASTSAWAPQPGNGCRNSSADSQSNQGWVWPVTHPVNTIRWPGVDLMSAHSLHPKREGATLGGGTRWFFWGKTPTSPQISYGSSFTFYCWLIILCTYRINWARRAYCGWRYESDEAVLQTPRIQSSIKYLPSPSFSMRSRPWCSAWEVGDGGFKTQFRPLKFKETMCFFPTHS